MAICLGHQHIYYQGVILDITHPHPLYHFIKPRWGNYDTKDDNNTIIKKKSKCSKNLSSRQNKILQHSKLCFLPKSMHYALCNMKFTSRKCYLICTEKEKKNSNHIYIDTITGGIESKASFVMVLRTQAVNGIHTHGQK